MRTVFLDLDGTLVDPKPGITDTVRYALRELGQPVPRADDLHWVIGPPLLESFATLGVPDPQEALDLYRVRYTAGSMYDTEVYPGIPAALAALKARGDRLVLMTAKPHVYARKITERLGLAAWLDAQYGPELDGTRNDKAELLGHAMAELGVAPVQAVMVGDRRHDIAAARANGIGSLAVAWGYGMAEEWREADTVCKRVPDLPDAITSLLPG